MNSLRRQLRTAHQRDIDRTSGLAAFGNRPHHQRLAAARVAGREDLRIRGLEVVHRRLDVAAIVERHAEGLQSSGVLGTDGIDRIATSLRRVERYWADQIRYIY